MTKIFVSSGNISIAANIEAIREAQEAMASASGENAAVMFDKAIQSMRNEIGQSSDSMFNAVSAAVNMQQEKASINSGDRAAAFHDEHAAGEKDDLPGKCIPITYKFYFLCQMTPVSNLWLIFDVF